MSPRPFALALIFGLSFTRGAFAQRLAPVPTTANAAAIHVSLALGDSGLAPEAVRQALERELKRPVELEGDAAAGGLSITALPGHTLSASYRAPKGELVTRSIALPREPERALEVIALLCDNLSRDEAAELLAALPASSPSSSKAAPAPAPTSNDSTTPSAEPLPQPAAEEHPKNQKKPENRPSNPPSNAPRETPEPLLTTPSPAFNLSLVPPLTLLRNPERRVINAEFGLGLSRVGEVRGGALNVLLLEVMHDVHGASFATLYNRTHGKVNGVTLAAGVNAYDALSGCGISAGLELGGDLEGCAISGGAVLARDGSGLEISGGYNAARDFQGLQVTGGWNRTRRSAGVQVVGGLNTADRFSGLQVAGGANVAERIAGAQIGVINVAGEVKGLQLGVINIARHVDGTSLGVVSAVGNGRIQPTLWASSTVPFNGGVKFLVGHFYTLLGGGYSPNDHRYALEPGAGAHLTLDKWFLEPGVHYLEVHDTLRSFSAYSVQSDIVYRLSLGLDLGPVSPFAGAALLQRLEHGSDVHDTHALSVDGFLGAAFL